MRTLRGAAEETRASPRNDDMAIALRISAVDSSDEVIAPRCIDGHAFIAPLTQDRPLVVQIVPQHPAGAHTCPSTTRVSSTTLCAPSLAIRFARCSSTVFGLIFKSSAMTLLSLPFMMPSST